jgi:putative transposase
MRLRTRRVTNWRHGEMVLRWAAAAYLDTEKRFNRIMGYRDLWILRAALEQDQTGQEVMVA